MSSIIIHVLVNQYFHHYIWVWLFTVYMHQHECVSFMYLIFHMHSGPSAETFTVSTARSTALNFLHRVISYYVLILVPGCMKVTIPCAIIYRRRITPALGDCQREA